MLTTLPSVFSDKERTEAGEPEPGDRGEAAAAAEVPAGEASEEGGRSSGDAECTGGGDAAKQADASTQAPLGSGGSARRRGPTSTQAQEQGCREQGTQVSRDLEEVRVVLV